MNAKDPVCSEHYGGTHKSIHDAFLHVARSMPDKVAVTTTDARVTYGELLERAQCSAATLNAHGCAEGDTVAVIAGHSVDFIASLLGTLSIGAVFAPLNPTLGSFELDSIIAKLKPRAAIYDRAASSLACGEPARETRKIASEQLYARAGISYDTSPTPLDSPALSMFSSGITGSPKRIIRTHRQLLNECIATSQTMRLTAHDVLLCVVPLSHAYGFTNMLPALLSGAALVFAGGDFNARRALRLLEQERITIFPGVPLILKALAETPHVSPRNMQYLRAVICGGGSLAKDVQKKFFDQFGIHIAQRYGSTETGPITINLSRSDIKPYSVGRPVSGCDVEIRRSHGGGAPGPEVGEIWVRTSGMAQGYADLPEITDRYFRDGWFFTGDRGYLDEEGDLCICGRDKQVINVAGYKVDPLEVEAVLMSHCQIADAAVIGIDDPDYGEKLKAIVVLRGMARCTEAEVIQYAASKVAPFKVHKIVEFRTGLPRTSMGKLRRDAL